MIKRLIFILSLFSTTFSVLAQRIDSIDIATGPSGSNPLRVTTFKGKAYFFALGDTFTGYELWSSDGTRAGTTMVKDICEGPSSMIGIVGREFIELNDRLFFPAWNCTNGYELWATDGSTSGTYMVSDIWPGHGSAYPSFMTLYNGQLYFTANDSVHGYELWATDGTASGTRLVKDINPGKAESYPAGTGSTFTVYNGRLYFRADDGLHGVELWSTDGTTAGTSLVADIAPGPFSAGASPLYVYHNALYFAADDSVHGSELWTSEGSSATTHMVRDINPGRVASYPAMSSSIIEYNDKLYFQAETELDGTELWSTDGTTAGTTMVKDIWPGSGSSYPGGTGMFVYDNRLFFAATDSLHDSQLWVSDGSAAGTILFKILSTTLSASGTPYNFLNFNGRLLFQSSSTYLIRDANIWVSDGTTSGTQLLQPEIKGADLSIWSRDTLNGSLLFKADFENIGSELCILTAPNSGRHNNPGIGIYPNPFDGTLFITGLNSQAAFSVSISDLTGRQYFISSTVATSASTAVALPDFPTGLYVIKIDSETSHTAIKMRRN